MMELTMSIKAEKRPSERIKLPCLVGKDAIGCTEGRLEKELEFENTYFYQCLQMHSIVSSHWCIHQ
jgi:hypothetical protein